MFAHSSDVIIYKTSVKRRKKGYEGFQKENERRRVYQDDFSF